MKMPFVVALLFAIMATILLPNPAVGEQPAASNGKPADTRKPVKVYILLGQSNMLEMGKVAGDKEGTGEASSAGVFILM